MASLSCLLEDKHVSGTTDSGVIFIHPAKLCWVGLGDEGTLPKTHSE